jgi:hypothetical protein
MMLGIFQKMPHMYFHSRIHSIYAKQKYVRLCNFGLLLQILFTDAHEIKYCDVDGVSYATASKIHVTSDVSVATQRLRIPRQPNC